VHGIQVGDLDRTQNPCTDFYAYANGSWRAANPIPASMVRWSRRWMAGEQNKEQLKVVLEEVAARRDWPTKSVEQLTGDFYAACMDQAAVDRAGLAPIEHLLVDLARMHTRADLQRIIARLHGLDIAVPFAVASAQDLHEPTRVLAEISAGTRGMPDRDYYLRAEPRFVEARKKYEEHVARMFVLAGFSRPRAAAAATTVLRMETEQARAALARAELREPKNQDHPMSLAALQRLAHSFSWGPYCAQAKIPTARINVTEPALLTRCSAAAVAPVSDWSISLRWHPLWSAFLASATRSRSRSISRNATSRAQEPKPRWEALRGGRGRAARRGAGKNAQLLLARAARMRVLVDNLPGDEGEHRNPDLMGPETSSGRRRS
jgi:endothelin-converting enzyme/putative endopeptidase